MWLHRRNRLIVVLLSLICPPLGCFYLTVRGTLAMFVLMTVTFYVFDVAGIYVPDIYFNLIPLYFAGINYYFAGIINENIAYLKENEEELREASEEEIRDLKRQMGWLYTTTYAFFAFDWLSCLIFLFLFGWLAWELFMAGKIFFGLLMIPSFFVIYGLSTTGITMLEGFVLGVFELGGTKVQEMYDKMRGR